MKIFFSSNSGGKGKGRLKLKSGDVVQKLAGFAFQFNNFSFSDAVMWLNFLSELFPRVVEHLWLHHSGGKHHRCNPTGQDRFSQTVSGGETHQTASQKCQRQNSPLHLCPVFQGEVLKWSQDLRRDISFDRHCPMCVSSWVSSSSSMP